ncbi:MAG: SagB/ThcOx family dehydrogenase [Bacteroidales bacterium]|nr:SagB/ThcOx family dehydrogenase [Bacteroidales bacterium]
MDIRLPAPDLKRQTLPFMEALLQRRSIRSYSPDALSLQDLSDLLWAAQGKNRENGRLTSPTAKNCQEIDMYVFSPEDVSLYDPQTHSLKTVVAGDHRDIVADSQNFPKKAPVILLMVGDMEKYGAFTDHAFTMVHSDGGIVSENINLFCSAAGLCTVSRGIMDIDAIRSLLNLPPARIPILNNPVGYPATAE